MSALTTLRRRSGALALLLATSVFAVACGDDQAPEENEPNIATLRLTVGNQVVNISETNGAVTGGPLVLTLGANTITAQFLLANGQPDPVVTAADFQLSVAVAGGAPITFTRSGTNPFSGTLTATATVTGAQISFGAFHIEEQHDDFGPFPVTVNVTQ